MKSHLLLYDQDCYLCRNLALLAQKHAQNSYGSKLAIQSLQDFSKIHPLNESIKMDLALVSENRYFFGKDAWKQLLQILPILKPLSWIATKLGLEDQTANGLNFLGHAARRLCIGCYFKN